MRPVRRRALQAGAHGLPAAVRRVGPHPVAGRQHHLPRLLLQLRAGWYLPRHRPGLPLGESVRVDAVPTGSATPGDLRGRGDAARRQHRGWRTGPHILRRPASGGTAPMGHAADRVRGGRGLCGGHRRRCGPQLQQAGTARGLQVGPGGLDPGGPGILGPVVPGIAADRLGGDSGRADDRPVVAVRPDRAVGGSGCSAAPRGGARHRVVRFVEGLVPVLRALVG